MVNLRLKFKNEDDVKYVLNQFSEAVENSTYFEINSNSECIVLTLGTEEDTRQDYNLSIDVHWQEKDEEK